MLARSCRSGGGHPPAAAQGGRWSSSSSRQSGSKAKQGKLASRTHPHDNARHHAGALHQAWAGPIALQLYLVHLRLPWGPVLPASSGSGEHTSTAPARLARLSLSLAVASAPVVALEAGACTNFLHLLQTARQAAPSSRHPPTHRTVRRTASSRPNTLCTRRGWWQRLPSSISRHTYSSTCHCKWVGCPSALHGWGCMPAPAGPALSSSLPGSVRTACARPPSGKNPQPFHMLVQASSRRARFRPRHGSRGLRQGCAAPRAAWSGRQRGTLSASPQQAPLASLPVMRQPTRLQESERHRGQAGEEQGARARAWRRRSWHASRRGPPCAHQVAQHGTAQRSTVRHSTARQRTAKDLAKAALAQPLCQLNVQPAQHRLLRGPRGQLQHCSRAGAGAEGY